MAGSRNLLSSTFLVPLEAPVPVFATYQASTQELIVEFNKPLRTGPTRNIQWRVWNGANRIFNPGGFGTVFGRLVTAFIGLLVPDPQPIHMAFTNIADDVVAQNGLPAASFDPFPVTFI